MDKPPDYAGLIRLIFHLRVFPDATGETTLTSEEAAKIGLLGFSAEAGRWKCPPLPPHLTRDNLLLEPLSARWDERSLLHEARNSERNMTPPMACQQNPEAHLIPQRSVEAVDTSLGYSEAERPVQLLGEGPDWELIEEAASRSRGP